MERKESLFTIGLPVFNGASTVANAIASLLGQTREDFKLIVADNASTDETGTICLDLAARDSRIRYVRHAKNMGAPRNFAWVLERADTPFFMWAAADDTWSPTYAARNLAVLEARADFVCSVSRVDFVDHLRAVVSTVGPPENKHTILGGTYPLVGTPEENLLEYLLHPECNTRFYGIHRTDVIRRCYSRNERYLASDWVVMARTLAFGKHHEVPEVLMQRSVRGASSDVTRLILETNPSFISRYWLPLLPMTRRILLSRVVLNEVRSWQSVKRLAEILWTKNRDEIRHHRDQLRIRGVTARSTSR